MSQSGAPSKDTSLVSPSNSLPIKDVAPSEPHVTEYDREHITIYLRLLDAAEDKASWEEAAQIVLGIDPAREPERARRAHETHLARARWLSAKGYRDLLREG